MKGGYRVKLSKRQEQIAQIVREEGPVTGSAKRRLLLCRTFKGNTNG